jgi:hypothetical protein
VGGGGVIGTEKLDRQRTAGPGARVRPFFLCLLARAIQQFSLLLAKSL